MARKVAKRAKKKAAKKKGGPVRSPNGGFGVARGST